VLFLVSFVFKPKSVKYTENESEENKDD